MPQRSTPSPAVCTAGQRCVRRGVQTGVVQEWVHGRVYTGVYTAVCTPQAGHVRCTDSVAGHVRYRIRTRAVSGLLSSRAVSGLLSSQRCQTALLLSGVRQPYY